MSKNEPGVPISDQPTVPGEGVPLTVM